MPRFLVSQELILTIEAENELQALEIIPEALAEAIRTGQYLVGDGCYVIKQIANEP